MPFMFEGLQVVSIPAGEDEVVSATVPVKPPVEWRVIVDVVESPATNETVLGFAEREKSGPAGVVKNSFMLGAFWSFDVRGGRFQFDSIVERTEKWS